VAGVKCAVRAGRLCSLRAASNGYFRLFTRMRDTPCIFAFGVSPRHSERYRRFHGVSADEPRPTFRHSKRLKSRRLMHLAERRAGPSGKTTSRFSSLTSITTRQIGAIAARKRIRYLNLNIEDRQKSFFFLSQLRAKRCRFDPTHRSWEENHALPRNGTQTIPLDRLASRL